MRGDVHRLSPPRTSGHEQQGSRYAVVVMADWLSLSTVLVAPTSTSAASTVYRPDIELQGRTTKVMCEQVAAVDLQRLGPPVSHLTYEQLTKVSDALRLVLDLGPLPSSLPG